MSDGDVAKYGLWITGVALLWRISSQIGSAVLAAGRFQARQAQTEADVAKCRADLDGPPSVPDLRRSFGTMKEIVSALQIEMGRLQQQITDHHEREAGE